MKKLLISMFILVATICSLTVVNAATPNETLKNYVENGVVLNGKSYNITADQRVQMDRFLATNQLTETQVNTVIAKSNEAIALLEKEDTSDLSKIPVSVKTQVVNLAKEAGNTLNVNVKVNFENNTVIITDLSGNVIGTTLYANNKLPFTGTDVAMYVAVASILIISVAMIYSLKKGLLNSEN